MSPRSTPTKTAASSGPVAERRMASLLMPLPSRPWYREPLVWLVIAIPATSVVMGVVMVWLAVASDDGLVRDDYYRSGLEINRVLDRDRAARRRGLAATLMLDPRTRRVKLGFDAAFTANQPAIELHMFHATRSGFDRTLTLRLAGDGVYVGKLPPLEPGAWNLEVGGSDWRIGGRLEASPTRAAEVLLAAPVD